MMELLATIIPALLTMIVTYIIANRRVRLQQAKLMTDMQVRAIEAVTKAESEMRKEIWEELEKCQIDGNKIKEENQKLHKDLDHSNTLVETYKEEIILLKKTNQLSEEEIDRLKVRIDELEAK